MQYIYYLPTEGVKKLPNGWPLVMLIFSLQGYKSNTSPCLPAIDLVGDVAGGPVPHGDPLALAGRRRPQRLVVGVPGGVRVASPALLVEVDAVHGCFRILIHDSASVNMI